jgi:divalent metal cation (Fe/Co/Zn/Cd) transporter
VVLGEDIAALLGLFFALVAVVLSMITGNAVFDAYGSIVIGALLILVSFFIAFKVKNLLIGQSADSETCEEIKALLETRPEIDQVLNLITIQLGAQIMVAVKAKMARVDTVDQLIDNINACELALKKSNSTIQWVFFEPDHKD